MTMSKPVKCPRCGVDLCKHGVFWYVDQLGRVERREDGRVVVHVGSLGDAHATRCSSCGGEIGDLDGWEYV